MDSRELDEPSALRWMAGRKVEFPVVKVMAGASSLCWMADWCVKVSSRPEPNSRGDGCRLATTLQEGS